MPVLLLDCEVIADSTRILARLATLQRTPAWAALDPPVGGAEVGDAEALAEPVIAHGGATRERVEQQIEARPTLRAYLDRVDLATRSSRQTG